MTIEPEIDVLGRVARGALHVLRAISILGGLLAIAGAVYTVIDPVPVYSDDVPPTSTVIAHQITFVCLGLPFLPPAAFTLGRGRWIALTIGALLWFGPMAVEGDHDYGFVIRMFASLVAVAVLAVWRTLIGLTNPTKEAAGQRAADDRERHPEAELRE